MRDVGIADGPPPSCGLRNELCFGPVNGDTVVAGSNLAWRSARASLCRQVHRHPSLNAGIPETRIDGVLGVRLGGRDFCGGSICLLLISDYLWKHGIILSTFHEQEQLESLALID